MLCIPKQICSCVFFSTKWLDFLSRHCLPSKVSVLFVFCPVFTNSLTHQPFYSEIFAFSLQNDTVSFWRAYLLGDNSAVQSPGGAMAIYSSPAAGNMTSGCCLRSSSELLWQRDKFLSNPCSLSLHPLPRWLALEAIHQNQLHFILQPLFRAQRDSLVLQMACDDLPRRSVQTSNPSFWECHRVFNMISLTVLFCFYFTIQVIIFSDT